MATLSQSLEEERKRSTELEHKVEEQAATATPDPSVLQTEVEKRMAALVQSSSGQDPTEAEKVIAAERARAVEENSKTLQAEFEKTLSEKDIAHQQALKDLQERVEKSQSEASNSTAYSQQVQDMQKSLREAREKVKTLDALQSDFAKLKEHSNATMTEVENLRQRESQLQNDLQQARAALQEKKTADSKGFSQEDLNAKIQEAVAEESNKRDAEIKSAVAKVQSEEKMKYNIHKNSAATLRTQLKATKEQLTAVQGQLQAAQTGGKAASPVASTSTAPSSTAISSAGLSIKGTGGAKPSDLPPMPVSKGKGAASKAPQAAKTAATAATATTPSAGTSPRGRGRGRLLGNAVSFLAEAASGQPGTKRARDEGQDSTSESDSGQKRRALGRGT